MIRQLTIILKLITTIPREPKCEKLNVNVNTEYNKKVLSKDKTGKITEYEISTDITFKIDQKNSLSRELVISETKIMKAISDKFEEQKKRELLNRTLHQ